MTETPISSRDNPLFKRLKKLSESARARREAQRTLLDGEHLLTAYLDAGGQPHTLVRAASFDAARLAPFAARCSQAKAIVLSDALFAELAPVATPTGVLAEAAWLAPAPPTATPLAIALEDIQDPGNLGSMLRTAAAAGATLAVLSKGCHDPWSPKALRGGQGAQFVLPMQLDADVPAWLAAFAGNSVALTLGEARDFYAED
ncbi:MAG: TrmH family RNA methyltransferase, partial [Thiobacillus sp.]